MNEREIILEALMEILEKKEYSHLVMRGVLDKYAYLEKQQRSFIKRCCEGTLEQMLRLDYCIDRFSKIKCHKMKPLIRTLLRMSAYQIMFMDQVPDRAACNEAVKLAKKRGFSQLSGFVNGVLRSLSREKDSIPYPDKETDPVHYLSIQYSMPQWMTRMWMQRYGVAVTEKMLAGLLGERPLMIRMRESISSVERSAYLDRMKEKKIVSRQNEKLAYAYELENYDSVATIPGYEEGIFTMQDIGSMLVVEMAGIKEADFVVDVCAAPGGKAIHAADKLMGSGQVIARDLTEYKISLIEENMQRMQTTNVKAEVWDARVLDDNMVQKADVVIADLPCSGLGVIGRKSDIKYRVTKEDVDDIAKLQRDILNTVWQYVKIGGTLVYSTCTVTKQENEDNRDYILAHLPLSLVEERSLLPGVDASDGFYMAKFRRQA